MTRDFESHDYSDILSIEENNLLTGYADFVVDLNEDGTYTVLKDRFGDSLYRSQRIFGVSPERLLSILREPINWPRDK